MGASPILIARLAGEVPYKYCAPNGSVTCKYSVFSGWVACKYSAFRVRPPRLWRRSEEVTLDATLPRALPRDPGARRRRDISRWTRLGEGYTPV